MDRRRFSAPLQRDRQRWLVLLLVVAQMLLLDDCLWVYTLGNEFNTMPFCGCFLFCFPRFSVSPSGYEGVHNLPFLWQWYYNEWVKAYPAPPVSFSLSLAGTYTIYISTVLQWPRKGSEMGKICGSSFELSGSSLFFNLLCAPPPTDDILSEGMIPLCLFLYCRTWTEMSFGKKTVGRGRCP